MLKRIATAEPFEYTHVYKRTTENNKNYWKISVTNYRSVDLYVSILAVVQWLYCMRVIQLFR